MAWGNSKAFLRRMVIESEFGDKRSFKSLTAEQKVWVDEHLDEMDEELRCLVADAMVEFGVEKV